MLRPLNKRIILKIEEMKSTSKSGILLSTISKSQDIVGKVVATTKNSELNVDDSVIFEKTKATTYVHDEVKYLIIKEEDILAVIEGESK